MSAEQDQRMRQVLGELELLSHGDVQRLDPAAAGGGDGIPGDMTDSVPHEYWRAVYEAAGDDRDRERAIEGAQHRLASWRGHGHAPRADLPTDAQILAAQILDAGGWPAADVARHLRCTVTMVRRVRGAAGISDDISETVVTIEHADAARMRELSGRGMTVRQIAMLTHTTRSDVHKALKCRPSRSNP